MQFRLPLSSSRVVEVTTSTAAALCARLLGDLGAEVIKVEPPSTEAGEEKRRHVDYNKLGLTLDASRTAGKDLLLRLISRANVLVLDNNAPAAATLDELRAVRPDAIIARILGSRSFGNVAIEDVIAGTALAGGALSALLRHRRSGEGALIEVDVLKSAAAYVGEGRGADELGSLAAGRIVEPVSHSTAGLVEVAGPIWHFSETPIHVRLPSPRPGEHNRYVLVDLLGLGTEEVLRLVDEGIVGSTE